MTGASSNFTESEVEEAALEWLRGLGWAIAHGPNIAPDSGFAERSDYRDVILGERLRLALARLNPGLPSDALDDAFGKLIRPEGTTLETRNRALHRMLVDGVNVEHRVREGEFRGAQVSVIDFEDPGQQRFSGGQSVHGRRGRARASAGYRSFRQRPSAWAD